MKALRLLSFSLLAIVLLASCSEDDLPPEKVDYEVEIRLEGDVDEFNWSLALDTERDGSGFPNQFEFNPPGGSFFQTDELDANVTYTFTAIFVDKIKVQFTNLLRSTIEPNETKTMSIHITIRRGLIASLEGEVTNLTEIGSFSRAYTKNSSTELTETEFVVISTNENNAIECQGNYCQ